MGHGLEQQHALAGHLVARDDQAQRLLVGNGGLHLASQVDRLLAHQHGWFPEEAPALCRLEGLAGAQLVLHGLGQGHDAGGVCGVGQVGGAQVGQPRNFDGIVVAKSDALAVGLALAGQRGPALLDGPLLLELAELQPLATALVFVLVGRAGRWLGGRFSGSGGGSGREGSGSGSCSGWGWYCS